MTLFVVLAPLCTAAIFAVVLGATSALEQRILPNRADTRTHNGR